MLRANKTVVPEAEPEVFEQANAKPEVPEQPAAESKPPAVRAAAKESAVSVEVKSTGVPNFKSLVDAMDPAEFGNTFPRIVGTNGNVALSDGTALFGEYVFIQVLSISDRFMITPVTDPNDKAKQKEGAKFCRAAYGDGTVIIDNEGGEISVEDYIEDNKRFFPEWKKSKYMDVYGIIFGSHKNSETACKLGVVQISVSKTATKAFKAFFMQAPLSEARGIIFPSHRNCMKVTASPQNRDGNNYTILQPQPLSKEEIGDYIPTFM